MDVPGGARETSPEPEPEPAVAPEADEPEPGADEETPEGGAGPGSTDRPTLRSLVWELAATARGLETARWPRWRDVPARVAAGMLSVVYGAFALTLVPLGFFEASGFIELIQPVAAVLIVVGGVLVLKRHEQGPAVVGLSCAILCFFPLLFAVLRAMKLMNAFRPGALLVVLLQTALLYAVPALVVAWAIREEARKGEDWE
jgi:hypothetical protein